jgi:hypothetical protein
LVGTHGKAIFAIAGKKPKNSKHSLEFDILEIGRSSSALVGEKPKLLQNNHFTGHEAFLYKRNLPD